MQSNHPDKQDVRNWIHRRHLERQAESERKPVPTPERIREELGWDLIEAEREAQQPR
jgi:hypothetical protein